MDIKLSPTEVAIARYIGKKRNELSLATKLNARRDPNQSDEEMNIQAVGAELAVAKCLNVYPDLSPVSGDLPKLDLFWNKRIIEVKRNHELQGDLLVPKLNEIALYFLACGELPLFKIVGWINGDQVPYVGEWAELKYGACWRVRPGSLKPVGASYSYQNGGKGEIDETDRQFVLWVQTNFKK